MQTTLTASAGIKPDLENIDWAFNGVETDYLTHGIHDYPARMIPQIPNALFEFWLSEGILSKGDLVYDPFCGSGTTPTEARLHGLNSIATDINPFACLLARAKSESLDLSHLKAAINRCLGIDWLQRERFIDEAHQEATERHPVRFRSDIVPENDGNRNYHPSYVAKGWFPEPQITKIESMHRFLRELRGEYDHQYIRFIQIALAKTARELSYQRQSEFKRHRIPEDDRASHNPRFTPLFRNNLQSNFKRLKEYSRLVTAETTADIRLADARNPGLEGNSASAIVTSPPYGDHKTTVGYGQFSEAPAAAATSITKEQMKNVDPTGLGGKRSGPSLHQETTIELSPTLKSTVDELRASDGRVDDVLEFFNDYAKTLVQMAKVIKPGQPVAIVVGNRTVSRIPIPMHLITTEIALEIGLEHEHTFPRSIPSKRLPYANAPENTPGVTGAMIADEYILIFHGEA